MGGCLAFPPPHQPHAGSTARLPLLPCGSSPARVLGNKQPRVCTTAGERQGLPLALQTCPALCNSCRLLSNAHSGTQQQLGLKVRAGSWGGGLYWCLCLHQPQESKLGSLGW